MLSLDYGERGTLIEAIVKPELWGRIKQFEVEAGPSSAEEKGT